MDQVDQQQSLIISLFRYLAKIIQEISQWNQQIWTVFFLWQDIYSTYLKHNAILFISVIIIYCYFFEEKQCTDKKD